MIHDTTIGNRSVICMYVVHWMRFGPTPREVFLVTYLFWYLGVLIVLLCTTFFKCSTCKKKSLIALHYLNIANYNCIEIASILHLIKI